jgi:hypothetical protein
LWKKENAVGNRQLRLYDVAKLLGNSVRVVERLSVAKILSDH